MVCRGIPILFVLATSASPSAADVAGKPRVLDEGRNQALIRLVRQDCGSCHGLTLKGGLGKPLLPEDIAALDASQVRDIILEGMPGTPMPAWKSLLTSEDATWIAEQLKKGFPQ